MKFPLTLTAIFALSTLASAATAECGRWTSCDEDSAFAAKTAAKLYIYGNTSDIEPWMPEVAAEKTSKLTSKTEVKSVSMGVSAESKDDLSEALSIENEYDTDTQPAGLGLSGLSLTDQKLLVAEVIAELNPQQKQYIASELAKSQWQTDETKSAYVVQAQE